ncbi:hypothetical protein [Endozoicomonas ascidiicola]|uniref:hypothetical protein n=1 Tax=Endozoicomonas ascidiicola TaxID=1698521 RepID=UPI00082D7EAA|nr:hypothetical protein [Endozoicomonas ascidiicola]
MSINYSAISQKPFTTATTDASEASETKKNSSDKTAFRRTLSTSSTEKKIEPSKVNSNPNQSVRLENRVPSKVDRTSSGDNELLNNPMFNKRREICEKNSSTEDGKGASSYTPRATQFQPLKRIHPKSFGHLKEGFKADGAVAEKAKPRQDAPIPTSVMHKNEFPAWMKDPHSNSKSDKRELDEFFQRASDGTLSEDDAKNFRIVSDQNSQVLKSMTNTATGNPPNESTLLSAKPNQEVSDTFSKLGLGEYLADLDRAINELQKTVEKKPNPAPESETEI